VIAHVVLFTPRPGLPDAQRRALLAAFTDALRQIPSIRRARVGRRHTHGRPGYERLMGTHYEYAAIVEFDDAAGLRAYLEHPAHEALGAAFFAASQEALMYDFELSEGADAAARLL
jgi:hypothetical protein